MRHFVWAFMRQWAWEREREREREKLKIGAAQPHNTHSSIPFLRFQKQISHWVVAAVSTGRRFILTRLWRDILLQRKKLMWILNNKTVTKQQQTVDGKNEIRGKKLSRYFKCTAIIILHLSWLEQKERSLDEQLRRRRRCRFPDLATRPNFNCPDWKWR